MKYRLIVPLLVINFLYHDGVVESFTTSSFGRIKIGSSSTTACYIFNKFKERTKSEVTTTLSEEEKSDTKTKAEEFDEQVIQAQHEKIEVIKFGGKVNITLPLQINNEETLFDSFSRPEYQKILLSCDDSDESEMEELDIISVDTNKWVENAKILGAEKPDVENDKVFLVMPGSISILPTVAICPFTIIGTKVTTRSIPNSGEADLLMPEFQSVLIEDNPRAKGIKPLVWLFNKMVYGKDPDMIEGNSQKEEKDEGKGKPGAKDEKAWCRYWIEKQVEEDESTYFLKGEAELFIEIDFPKFLLRFFPISKEKAEELCR